MPLTGVAGWPVAHSRSPALHEAAFASLGLADWRSQLLPIPPDLFAETVAALPGEGFVGINVTIPHKLAALRLADRSSPTAQACGAANTLSFHDGVVSAENTDVPAIESALEELAGDGGAPRVLVLGAGGSARAALLAAARIENAGVEIWNRTASRAEDLAAEFGVTATTDPQSFDLLVNTTSVGLDPSGAGLDDLPLEAAGLRGARGVVDLVYTDGGAPVARAAIAAGVPVIDGLEVLVRQGALSVGSWTGRVPDLAVLRRAVAEAA